MIKIKITYLLTIAVSVILLFIGHKFAVNGMIGFQGLSQQMDRAKVQKVVERVKPNYDFIDGLDDYENITRMIPGDKIVFEAKIISGQRKGRVITAEQTFTAASIDRSKEVERGDNILLVNNDAGWFFAGYVRTNALLVLGALFVICLIIFGGSKGFNTILSLGFTCTAVFAVFVPSILSGKNIYLMSVIICVFVIIIVNFMVIGFNKKSLASIAGCTGGVIVAGIITVCMDKALYITGIIDEHSRYLINLPGDLHLNLNAVVFAGIIIGAMGAIMDVSISISSSLWEVKEKAGNITFKELLNSGFNIGRDIMGSMADTLILAYIGSSLTIVLLLSVFSTSLLGLFNSEMIAVEILQALAGSLGILFAMPLTALFCSAIYIKKC
ncbi:MAG: YibE/F family protein [Treponema sp.]|nr:YibE/F family protein [Treponema sp.]